ncbi:UDP-glycosyltransferase 72D1-like [Lotus japonicus]
MAASNSHNAAILTPPGMGHMIPSLELAKRLVTHQIVPKVTIFLASIKTSVPSKAETQLLQSATNDNLFQIIHLPPLDMTNLVGPDATIETQVAAITHELPPLFLSAISTTEHNPTILIIDQVLSNILPLVENLKVPKFIFVSSNAWLLALSLHTPILDKELQGEYTDQSEPISIPGCKSVHPDDVFQLLRDRTHKVYREYLSTCEGLALADAILVNTFNELEPKTLAALSSGKVTKVPVYPVGLIVREEIRRQDGSDVFEWLDKQEEESVVYISLGSGYRMSQEQIKEMALGLELSGQRFVWSLRTHAATKAGDAIANYFTAGKETQAETGGGVSKSEELNSLPDEFYRIQTRGMVITDWAPQLDILKHPSVGGFVSHCGWNSVMESVSCGVPIVGWPLYAEQGMNAAMLAEEIGIAVRLELPLSTNVVGREDLAKAIRKVMDKEDEEGCEMRKKVKELKEAAKRAWSEDGSSYLALSRISQANGAL